MHTYTYICIHTNIAATPRASLFARVVGSCIVVYDGHNIILKRFDNKIMYDNFVLRNRFFNVYCKFNIFTVKNDMQY